MPATLLAREARRKTHQQLTSGVELAWAAFSRVWTNVALFDRHQGAPALLDRPNEVIVEW